MIKNIFSKFYPPQQNCQILSNCEDFIANSFLIFMLSILALNLTVFLIYNILIWMLWIQASVLILL